MAILFFISIFLIFHSYVLYPLTLWIASLGKRVEYLQYSTTDTLPHLSVIMAVHNEAAVIGRKIESIFENTYPQSLIEVIVGSDCSTDETNALLRAMESKYENLKVIEYPQRLGKVGVMNNLVDLAQGEVVVSTDANVMLAQSTLIELIKYFKDNRVGLVDTRMVNTGLSPSGISVQESAYINYEMMLKYREGLLWGSMMGPFGGCFAVRKSLYRKPPANALVDDFYINMEVLKQGKHAINSLEAVAFEDVSNLVSEEFRRKVRISIGNFQNLKRFYTALWPITKPLAFAFLSHKVLRWIGPILIMVAFTVSVPLAQTNPFFFGLLVVQLTLFLLPFLDMALKSLNIHSQFLRFITHFFSMNLALLVGLIKYLKGVNSNVWQPTQRNQ